MVSSNSSLSSDLSELGHALGLTGDDSVIPGDPAAMNETAQHLAKLGAACGRAAAGFGGIDTGRWQGKAADGFRGFLDTSPPRWRTAADAFDHAGAAVGRYASTLAESQQQAKHAQQQLVAAQQRSQQARQAHNAAVGKYNSAADAANAGGPPPGPAPAAFTDPAAEQQAQAQHQLDAARAAVQRAGQDAARACTEAAQRAPGKPGWFSQLTASFADSVQEQGRMLGSMASGAGEAIGGMVQLSRTLNPLDPWNMSHPGAAVHNASTLAAGMVNVVKNPYQGVKTMADVDGWKQNPAHALGSCVPNAIASLAGGAGVASRAASGVRRVATGARRAGTAASETARASRAAKAADRFETAPEHAEHSAGAGQQPAHTRWGRLPESSGPRPDITGSHAEHPGERVTRSTGHPEHTWNHNPHEQPWRPSSDPAPSRMGEHDPHMPTGHEPAGPHARPEHPGLDPAAHGHEHQAPAHHLPGHEPGREFEHALQQAQQHGDPIRFNQHEWGHLNAHDQLPPGLSRETVHSYPGAKDFLYRDLDPAQHPLFRKIQGVDHHDLHHVFEHGLASRHADAPADLGTLGAHMGNSGNPSPFISTTDNLGHALSRDGGFHDGVVLDIRDPGGHVIDADATFKHREGEQFISHGEGEKPYVGHVPAHHIRGGWSIVEGTPRWFGNPHFDHSILGSRP